MLHYGTTGTSSYRIMLRHFVLRAHIRNKNMRYTVYLEFFVITNVRVKFFRGSRIPTKIFLHLVYFYTRTHVPSIKYNYTRWQTRSNAYTEEPALFVATTFIARYGKQLLVKYSRYADLMERTVISLTPLESFRENGRESVMLQPHH